MQALGMDRPTTTRLQPPLNSFRIARRLLRAHQRRKLGRNVMTTTLVALVVFERLLVQVKATAISGHAAQRKRPRRKTASKPNPRNSKRKAAQLYVVISASRLVTIVRLSAMIFPGVRDVKSENADARTVARRRNFLAATMKSQILEVQSVAILVQRVIIILFRD